MKKRNHLKKKKQKISIDLTDDEPPEDVDSGAHPVEPEASPAPGPDLSPVTSRPQDHIMASGLKPLGIGDKDGSEKRDDDDGEERKDFYRSDDDEDDGFQPERLRGVLPGLLKMGYRMGAKTEITDADARMLTDQIIECAQSDESFASMLDWLPTDCMLTVGVTAFMIYLRSPKGGKGDENNLREKTNERGSGERNDLRGRGSGGEGARAGEQLPDYKFSPDRLGKPGVLTGSHVWG